MVLPHGSTADPNRRNQPAVPAYRIHHTTAYHIPFALSNDKRTLECILQYSSGAGTSASTTKHSTIQRTILEVVIGSETEEHNNNNIQQNVHAQLEVFLVPVVGSGKSVVQFAARRWRFASTGQCWCPIVSVRYRRHTLQKNAESGLCKY